MKIVALANQKGGVGKTTTAVNLSACLAEAGKSVLLIDLDPQANAGSSLGVAIHPNMSIYPVLSGQKKLVEQIQPTSYQHLHIVTADLEMAGSEIELAADPNRLTRLRSILHDFRNTNPPYDFVLLDCPPSLGVLMTNALASADTVLIPLQCEYLAMEGLAKILNMIELIRKAIGNQELQIEGIVLTMYDSRTNLSQQVLKDIREHLGHLVYQTVIPRSIRLGEAPSHGQAIITYDSSGIGSQSYRELAREFISHQPPVL